MSVTLTLIFAGTTLDASIRRLGSTVDVTKDLLKLSEDAKVLWTVLKYFHISVADLADARNDPSPSGSKFLHIHK